MSWGCVPDQTSPNTYFLFPYRAKQKQGIVVDYEAPGSLDFGGSPTHSKIHVGDLLLDYGTRRETKSHGKHGLTVTHTRSKKEVHDEMLKVLGIHVNEPRAGGSGTSNTVSQIQIKTSSNAAILRIP